MIDIDKKYKPSEVAKILGIAKPTLYQWIRLGKIKAYKQVDRYFLLGKDLKEFAEVNHFDIK